MIAMIATTPMSKGPLKLELFFALPDELLCDATGAILLTVPKDQACVEWNDSQLR